MNTQNTQKRIIVGDVLKEAWRLVSGLKWPIFWITILLPVTFSIVMFILAIFLIKQFLLLAVPLLILLSGVSFFLMWCMLSIVVMLGVRQAIGLPIDVRLVYSQCMQVKGSLLSLFFIWLAFFAVYAFVKYVFIPAGIIGLILNIALYLVCLYATLPIIIFALLLIITKRVSIQQALEEGYTVMNQYWLEIIACYVLMAIIGFISAIPLGIGLIWTIPMHYAMLGILFRNAYGLKRKPQNIQAPAEAGT